MYVMASLPSLFIPAHLLYFLFFIPFSFLPYFLSFFAFLPFNSHSSLPILFPSTHSSSSLSLSPSLSFSFLSIYFHPSISLSLFSHKHFSVSHSSNSLSINFTTCPFGNTYKKISHMFVRQSATIQQRSLKKIILR